MRKQKNNGYFQSETGSKISYNSIAANNTNEVKQKKLTVIQKVMDLLFDGKSRNSREISQALNVERTAITKALNDLIKSEKVKIAFDARCKQTNRRTGFYSLIQQKDGKQLDLLRIEKRTPKRASFSENY